MDELASRVRHDRSVRKTAVGVVRGVSASLREAGLDDLARVVDDQLARLESRARAVSAELDQVDENADTGVWPKSASER